ncbi:MAG: cytochrome c oxidase accessory protein CcoG [Gammaproteobacteria bacterium]|nr:MAG: cytochrome c oxidase accessory protein CcoG [Gammaproteobacteria bacterium]
MSDNGNNRTFPTAAFPTATKAVEIVPISHNLYEKRVKIQTRNVKGRFQRLRAYTGWFFLVLFFAAVWLQWGTRQAILWDLPTRKFYIFELTIWPQDLILLSGLLIISALSLFFVTIWLGRVWCGYLCPQTVWTNVFMWVERLCEGNRNQRIKMDNSPISVAKFFRRGSKHLLWLCFSFITAITFVGYFIPIRELFVQFWELQLTLTTLFWIALFTMATYLNAGWLREQVCIYMCPYARFQSAMYDPDTLVVTYDKDRGDKRGPRKKNQNPREIDLGDCVDCTVCVQVCPTGIDIRDGLQYECISCALCIDACNEVMAKIGYAPDLILYATEHEMAGTKTNNLRPRLAGYGLVIILMIMLFIGSLITRDTLALDVIRDRNQLFRITSENFIENSYTLKIMNKTQHQKTYSLMVSGLEGITLSGIKKLTLQPGEIRDLPIRLLLKHGLLKRKTEVISFHLLDTAEVDVSVVEESRFIGPLLFKEYNE